MKANEANLLTFIKSSSQFVIPIYQRKYSWEIDECRQLWDDIIRTGENDLIEAHFLGSIVYIEKSIYTVTRQSPQLVIDGQQRLTSIILLIAALANKLETLTDERIEIIDDITPRKLRHYYLFNAEEEGERRYKIILSEGDRDTLNSIIDGSELPQKKSIRVKENYNYFCKWIDEYSGKVSSIYKGIAKLIIVDIKLTKDQDNPQLIFESMNSTGKELTQADLIRNFILMGLDVKEQNRLYKMYWYPMEEDFGQTAYTAEFDNFMRHYLTVMTGNIPKKKEVYDAFKRYSYDITNQEMEVEQLVSSIRQYSKYYCAMILNKEEDKDLNLAFNDLKELRADVAYPMLLELYNDYDYEVLSKNEFLEVVRLIESYIFRRYICSIPTNSLNKTFATFMRAVDKNSYVESVKAQFMLLPSYRRFPNDEEFAKHFKTRDLYNSPRRSYWLRKIENFERKEHVEISEYTVEHIMPQNPNLSEAWRRELGENWVEVQETWLHTLGNLTLTGYNSEYSDRPFSEKRDMKDGFRDSPIRLNQSLRMVDTWNESAIKKRANIICDIAEQIWRAPNLPKAVIDSYRPQTEKKDNYSISDFRYLAFTNPSFSAHTRQLFETLRKEVLDIDSLVEEEFLKLYIAYKAETNFVDVVPLSSGLQLLLNMPYSEISDPKGISRDVTGIGKWGNGDVEVRLEEMGDIPYVMSLIRQSFDRQVSNGDDSE